MATQDRQTSEQFTPPSPQYKRPTMSPEDYANLTRVESNMNNLWQDIDKLESCGADCQALRAVIADSQNRIANMKKHFSPRS